MALDPVEIVGGLAIGTGLGGAISDTVTPRLETFKQSQWQAHPDKPLDLGTAAAVAAEDVDSYGDMEAEALLTGFDSTRFAHAWGETLNAPGIGTLLELQRRAAEAPIDFAHGLRKAKLEQQWDAALRNLVEARLSPAEIALGIVRSVVEDPGLQVGANDTSGGVVPAYPVSSIDTLQEASFGGYDRERLRVLVGEIGLPMSLHEAASAYFRKIIELPDFYKAVAQGDTRPAWGPFILEQARQIPTAHDGIEARLRGWTDDAGMYAQTARHGMSEADTDLILKVSGRPLSFHQVFIGERRGGTYDGPTTGIDAAFLKSLQESNVRPEWYNLAWAQRYAYPTAFVLRSLTQTGEISEQDAHNVLLFEGWEPTFAAKVAAAWATPAAAKADPWVGKADTQLWTATHKGYVGGAVDVATAQAAFGLIGIAADAQTAVLARWDAEKAL